MAGLNSCELVIYVCLFSRGGLCCVFIGWWIVVGGQDDSGGEHIGWWICDWLEKTIARYSDFESVMVGGKDNGFLVL